jgi:hypothetical protein
MLTNEQESIGQLVRTVVGEAQELVRDELAIFRAEVRQEIAAAQAAGIWFSAAAVAALLAMVLFCVALGAGLAALFGWPTWAGYGLVAVLLAVAAALFATRGRSNVSAVRGLPITKASLKENLTWIQSRSASR